MTQTANDYRIEKARCQVAVTTMDGERLVGDMFLQPYAHRRAGPEAPADLLNDTDPFFPLALADGTTLLLAKELMREVEVPDDRPSSDEEAYVEASVRFEPVELTLLGGVVRVGSVRLELPYERPRLLDFFNRFAERYLTVYADDGVRLVNRRCIERVRPLEA
jgi:hypothetical protein